ncbi:MULTISPECIES: hypothetical protein [unclassified Geodermatophilus]
MTLVLAALGVSAAVAAAGAVLVAPRSSDGPEQATSTATSVPSVTAAPPATASETASSVPSSPPPRDGGGGLPVAEVTPPAPEDVATDAPPPSDGDALQAVLTSVTWEAANAAVQATGYVSGVVEVGGTCTLTLTSGPTVLSTTTQALADASTTSCGQISLADPRLSTGTWQAVLSYVSDTGEGASQAAEVVVP